MVDFSELKPHPKNANIHPGAQIERLAEILRAQGWRSPIKVSNQSGFMTAGHGRLEAAKLNHEKFPQEQWNLVPVNFQNYENSDLELADLHADNSIASWANLDLSLINTQLAELDPGFNLDLLGLKDFVLEPLEKFEEPQAKSDPTDKGADLNTCPNCGVIITNG